MRLIVSRNIDLIPIHSYLLQNNLSGSERPTNTFWKQYLQLLTDTVYWLFPTTCTMDEETLFNPVLRLLVWWVTFCKTLKSRVWKAPHTSWNGTLAKEDLIWILTLPHVNIRYDLKNTTIEKEGDYVEN